MDLGLATNYIPSELILKTKNNYIENGNINTDNFYPEISSEIIENKILIESSFKIISYD